jgi:hypothetical protein
MVAEPGVDEVVVAGETVLSKQVEVELLKLAWRIFYAVGALVIAAVVAAFGVGAFFATMDSRMANVEKSVGRIEIVLTDDFAERIRALETQAASGNVPEARRRIELLEERVRVIEKSR